MSSNNPVKMVRIQSVDNGEMKKYDDNMTVSILTDRQRHLSYLCIMKDGERVYKQEFSELKWIPESSMNGVMTIRSSNFIIVITYDAKNGSLLDWFVNLRSVLKPNSQSASSSSMSSQLNEDQTASMIDSLITSINTDNSNDAEAIAQELAKLQVQVQFNLLSKNDNQEKNMDKSIDDAESSDPILQLTVRIECQMVRDPILASINVRSGTTLYLLKQQIENETGIKTADQYWFAFDRYPISDEYVFGSIVSVVSNLNQQQPPINYIRSGDSLILYIASISPLR